MQIDVINILNSKNASREFEADVSSEPISFLGIDFVFNTPLHVKANMANENGKLILSANVKGKIGSTCARCLCPIDIDVDFYLCETFVSDSEYYATTQEDVVYLTGTKIDIGDFVINDFISNSPAAYLCKEDCLGICSHCYTNLNVRQCDCNKEQGNSRFGDLDKLFEN